MSCPARAFLWNGAGSTQRRETQSLWVVLAKGRVVLQWKGDLDGMQSPGLSSAAG